MFKQLQDGFCVPCDTMVHTIISIDDVMEASLIQREMESVIKVQVQV